MACRVSAERLVVKRMEFRWYVTCCFSLAALNILSLYLIFVSLISMCLGVFLLGFIQCGTLSAFWTWLTISFPCWGNFQLKSIQKFSHTLSLSLLFFFSSSSSLNYRDPYNNWLSSVIFFLFTLFCSSEVVSTILSSSSLIHSSSQIFYYWILLEYF